eukprot:COSAG02_NODE_877_length_16272_cov_8.002288_10_plen_131_part_00
MNDCVTDQFIGVLQHTQQHVISEHDKSAYDAEAAEWSADLWARTGSGLPSGFYENRRSNSIVTAAAVERSESVPTKNLATGSPSSDDDLTSLSAAELSAQVDSILTATSGSQGNDGEAAAGALGRHPRQP